MSGARGRGVTRQDGSAIVLVMVGLLALLAMGGLAFDIGHLTLNKARLQSVLDAAALGAAKTLYDQGGTEAAKADATAAATEIISTNAATYRELASALSGGLAVAVEYSNTLSPFVNGTMPVNFVRVRAENFNMLSTLARVVGIDSITTRSSAVAGPQGTTTTTSGTACNILPVMMCANNAAGAPMWGYQPGQLVGLKNGANSNPAAAGPGNYYLIRLGGSGANIVRDNLAGAYEGCATMGGSLETEPGNESGPTQQGINTRFNQYLGPMSPSEFPPDVVISEPNPSLKLDCPSGNQTGSCVVKQGNTVVTDTSQIGYSYADNYVPRLSNGPYDVTPYPDGAGRFKRREVAVPIADCSGASGGAQTLPVVGFACVFLIQKVQGTGQNANIIGEIITSCDSGGASGPPTGTPNPSLSYKIVLYNDVDSTDS
jgi:Flp pilus assembly protein TadG